MNKHPCPYRTLCITWERPQRKLLGLKQRHHCDGQEHQRCEWSDYLSKNKIRLPSQ